MKKVTGPPEREKPFPAGEAGAGLDAGLSARLGRILATKRGCPGHIKRKGWKIQKLYQ